MAAKTTKKPRTLKHPGIVVVIIVIAVLAIAIVGGFLAKPNANIKAGPTPTVTSTALSTKAQLIADVKETTFNVKQYLKTHPSASASDIQNARISDTTPKYERVNIAGNYKVWYVVGQDTRMDKNLNYNYQSLTNTYRWYNNKTGKSTEVIEDSTARNTRATH